MVIEGTWEEIVSLSDKLSGRKVRLVVLTKDQESDEDDLENEPPMTIEEWEAEGDLLGAELARVWPEGLSAVDAVNEQRRF